MRRPRFLAVLALAALFVPAAGCSKIRVGAPCELSAGDGGLTETAASNATINPGAPECPGHICVQPAAETSTNTGALCSADCSSDSDCEDSETTRSTSDPRCKSGFSCVVLTTVGELCCRKLCACRDFFSVPAGGFPTPLACMPGSGSSCPNVH